MCPDLCTALCLHLNLNLCLDLRVNVNGKPFLSLDRQSYEDSIHRPFLKLNLLSFRDLSVSKCQIRFPPADIELARNMIPPVRPLYADFPVSSRH